MLTSEAIPDQLIAQARGGDPAALGTLLELYRNYLRLVARSLIGAALRVKIEPSDLVQETFLKAHQEFGKFRGQNEHELVAWLRRILSSTLADQVKHHRRKGRDLQRQESLDLLLERSDAAIQRASASSRPTIARSSSSVPWSMSRLRRSLPRWAAQWARCACSGPGRWSGCTVTWEGEAPSEPIPIPARTEARPPGNRRTLESEA